MITPSHVRCAVRALAVAACVQPGAFTQAAGIADLEFDVAANAETMFRIGSVTKQFTAAGIMRLVEQGKLELDDDIHTYLPDFDTGGRVVTIRQLLNHTSGVPSYTSQPTFFPKGSPLNLTHEELLAFIDGVPFDFEPGERWSYSNTGYYLLGMIIEAIDDRPYAQFLQDEFFTPLGLTRTRYGSEREIIKNRAQGYGVDPATGARMNDALISMNTPGAAGALLTWLPDEDLHVAVISNSEALPSQAVEGRVVAAITSDAPLPEPRTTQQPGAEEAVRRMIEELARGEPNYELLSPGLAEATRQQLPGLRQMFESLGPIESVTFQSVDLRGADVYDVKLANGSVVFMIVLDEEGRRRWRPYDPGHRRPRPRRANPFYSSRVHPMHPPRCRRCITSARTPRARCLRAPRHGAHSVFDCAPGNAPRASRARRRFALNHAQPYDGAPAPRETPGSGARRSDRAASARADGDLARLGRGVRDRDHDVPRAEPSTSSSKTFGRRANSPAVTVNSQPADWVTRVL